MERLGLDMQSVFGLPPVDYVNLAADLGCSHIAIGLTSLPWNPLDFPTWSLRTDRELRQAFKRALDERGVVASVLAGFSLKSDVDVRDLAPDMDLAVELGVRQLASVGMDRDIARAHDQLAILTEMAAARGMEVVLDYAPHQVINSLEAACAALRHAGSPHALLSLDAMHVFRAGATVADIAALDPALIGYAQVCDVPNVPPHDDYAREATFERLVPGEGDLPLRDFVGALPPHVLIGIEVPNRTLAQSEGLAAFMARAVRASRALLD
jgi:sugar phosphate isomerase/epimerase